uniref:CUE domain-containing protein n=1 Tax=Globodera rostochiensis TaxID=31243 RepID=A0A914H440_GLORO
MCFGPHVFRPPRVRRNVQNRVASAQLPQVTAQMPFSEEELDELQEMFPNIHKEVMRSVLEANGATGSWL